MAKIPFDIKYRPQIESGEYKVETKDGLHSVRIICWDAAGSQRDNDIIGLEKGMLGAENIQRYDVMGHLIADSTRRGNRDLFIITPEPEFTEWQTFISGCLQKHGLLDCGAADRIAKECSSELLAIAREQFIKDGYVIEKKAFHDAVKTVNPEVMKEVSESVDMQIALHIEYEKGRADALKDLPRWRKCADADRLDPYIIKPWIVRFDDDLITDSAIIHHGYYLGFADLEKLPGFKED